MMVVRFIFVGNNGTIGISTTKISGNLGVNSCSVGTQHPATFDFQTIKYYNNFYIGISTVGEMYYSFDFKNWNYRE